MTPQDNAEAAEIDRLKARVRKLAEEKSHLQLIVSLVERLNPLCGLKDMVRGLLYNIMDAIGGTNIKLYYWVDKDLHYIDFLGEEKRLAAIDDDLVAAVSHHHEFIELPEDKDHTLLQGDVSPRAWTWACPLLVGDELIGIIKLENLHMGAVSLRLYLPIFFSHAALILSNEIRSHMRREAEDALRKKTEELDNYFNNALDLFCIADIHGVFHKLNPEWERALGYSLTELEGRRFLDFVHPDDLPATLDAISALSGQNPVINFVNRYLHKDGSYRWIEWRSRPNGEMIFAAAHDITERKNAQDTLLQLNANLEQRIQEEVTNNRKKDLMLIQQSRLATMGEMMHNVAHQWRQPLNALNLILQNIRDAYIFGELNQEMLDKLVEDGDRVAQKMSSTIDDFRNFFRPNQLKTRFNLLDSVHEALTLVEASFRFNQIDVSLEAPAAIYAEGFPGEYSQVLLNVLVNAKDAIKTQQRPGTIAIRMEVSDGLGIVRIRDSGGGIPAEVLPKIFDPYFTTKDSGSGIGLYMSRMIVEHMHGRIEANNLDGGAEISIAVPIST